MRRYDVVVIGAGVVGLWTALLAARRDLSVALLERSERPGSMSSLRNSGVLHGGLYYEPGSLKAVHCVRGRRLTVEFLREQRVPHAVCGKYIVPAATREEDSPAAGGKLSVGDTADPPVELERLRDRARTNGVEDVEIVRIDPAELPFLHAGSALHVGCTGIVDLPEYVGALDREVRRHGVELFAGCECIAAEPGRVVARRADGAADETFVAGRIVNSAGLYADAVAALFGLSGFEVRPNKGSYFRLNRLLPVQKLVYPLPSAQSTFLGVHYTPDLRGQAWAGPNSIWADHKADLAPHGSRDAFHDGLSRIVRGYAPGDLIGPEKVGLRSRLFEHGEPVRDFVLREHPAGVVHLLGIESPGLTSAPSLAGEALTRLGL